MLAFIVAQYCQRGGILTFILQQNNYAGRQEQKKTLDISTDTKPAIRHFLSRVYLRSSELLNLDPLVVGFGFPDNDSVRFIYFGQKLIQNRAE